MTDGIPQLILICGLPGSGKSTLARRSEASIPAVRLCADEWLASLGVDLHDEPTRDRLEALFWQLAQRMLTLGISVVLESGFWLRSDRDEKRLGARALGAGVSLQYLNVPIDELWRRIESRNASGGSGTALITRDQLDKWAGYFEAPDSEELALFDAPPS